MQCVDGCVEVAVFLLQTCKLKFKFALIFVGHGLKRDEVAKVEAYENSIVPAAPVRNRVATSWLRERTGPIHNWFHTHDWLLTTAKYEIATFDTHRQAARLVYTPSSGSNLRSNFTEEVWYGNAGASC
jgi:hypothetical protein